MCSDRLRLLKRFRNRLILLDVDDHSLTPSIGIGNEIFMDLHHAGFLAIIYVIKQRKPDIFSLFIGKCGSLRQGL